MIQNIEVLTHVESFLLVDMRDQSRTVPKFLGSANFLINKISYSFIKETISRSYYKLIFCNDVKSYVEMITYDDEDFLILDNKLCIHASRPFGFRVELIEPRPGGFSPLLVKLHGEVFRIL